MPQGDTTRDGPARLMLSIDAYVPPPSDFVWNGGERATGSSPADTAPFSGTMPRAFHRRLPGYATTPLHDVPALARLLGVGQVLVKDESQRLGLPAFKMLGASWAVYCALRERLPSLGDDWGDVSELRERVATLRPLTLAAATDGNHGRAVARMARLLRFEAAIFVPAGTARARIDAIAGEGAAVEVVPGTYDDAVRRAAEQTSERCLVISDTAWPGYETVPRWVIAGYGTIFAEVREQLEERELAPPDLIAVQMGVGALAAATIAAAAGMRPRPRVVGVEPATAACVLASLRAGRPVTVPEANRSLMAGLNCDQPSPVAWPALRHGLDLAVAIPDDAALLAVDLLAAAGIEAGETGAAGLAGLLALLSIPDASHHRKRLGLTRTSRVLVLVTEGDTSRAEA
jgi:diaminopropionate ammonia-lyase